MTKIYLAGKISKNDWRNNITKQSLVTSGPFDKIDTVGGHEYVGPYFMSCDHGCFHGKSSHGLSQDGGACFAVNNGFYDSMGFTKDVIKQQCLKWIDNADIVLAWINSKDCYGTIAEIGYAHAKNKKIWIVYSTNLFKYPLGDLIEIPSNHDMWFIDQMAERICFADDPLQPYESWAVQDKHNIFIGE